MRPRSARARSLAGIGASVLAAGALTLGLAGTAVADVARSAPTGLSLSWVTRSPVIHRGDTGDTVAEWQALLNTWLAAREDDDGFRLSVDGVFGPFTDAVTRSVQNAEGLPVDGMVGPVTRAAYLSSPSVAAGEPDPAAHQPVIGRGDRGPAVREWQQQLRLWEVAVASDRASLVPDGDFGPLTEEATRAFQRAQGVTVDGIVGPETLAAMLSAPALVNRVASAPATDPPGTPNGPAPADAAIPAAGICAADPAAVVTIVLGDTLGEPRCVAVAPDQRVRILNAGSDAVTFFLAEHWTVLGPNGSALIDRALGEYLAPGVHTIHVSRFGGTGPELWLRT